MQKTLTPLIVLLMLAVGWQNAHAQQSSARQWNEVLLDAIRVDVGRPTVHSRNLFHTSIAMYDAWAAYDEIAQTYFLGNTVSGFTCDFDGISIPSDETELAMKRDETLSYACYRLLTHRFQNSPGAGQSLASFNLLMVNLGYDINFESTDYSSGSAAALGNYIGDRLIEFGLQDGSNEQNDYSNSDYMPVNPAINPSIPGTQGILDMNRWQPLSFAAGTETPFLNPHWGRVASFSLTPDDRVIYHRDGYDYWVYHDPGPPPYIDPNTGGLDDDYKWTFALVALWSSHLDPGNGVMWDISPATAGNIPQLPNGIDEMRDFYKLYEGGVQEYGYTVNPHTGQPYEPNIVPLGDFGRVIAEFWADGPASETPPGHWFTLMNYVSDHPMAVKRYKGEGAVLDDLEWDVKCYFTLGAAVHDVAVSVWGVKSWYDYIRPISALRGMAEIGQSSDPNLPNYDPSGIPLEEGYIELVEAGDPLEGVNGENIGKIKFYAWKGPDYIADPDSDYAGVDWILAENWWPYQRPSFVTPPFAGYVSGHSTFSRAAAEVLTLLTGDEYFPGGMGEFNAGHNEYLVFEDGPSMDITLQWAKYRDASDQASLSRLWGGIHPPVDDVPGRKMGIEIGTDVFYLAEQYFEGEATVTSTNEVLASAENGIQLEQNQPNPFSSFTTIKYHLENSQWVRLQVYDQFGRWVTTLVDEKQATGTHVASWNPNDLPDGMYVYRLESQDGAVQLAKNMILSR
jgi:hypothetical protein